MLPNDLIDKGYMAHMKGPALPCYIFIVRKTRGDDIDAACGQLAGDVIDRTKRTLRKRMQGEAIDIKAV